ncbi:hypothetical protein [Fictibacillus fluitans]|uniref:Uncharacterized protein n=1 Tax=Fictibacillus fluitans TaxID=3058422 RepID=A0ABT8HYI9_9BACL|nr:hypothetical protein [Fictibacillus sp. NE201]MDN4525530.1 hypothetical protein [Fictibacillus sp. NE201]
MIESRGNKRAGWHAFFDRCSSGYCRHSFELVVQKTKIIFLCEGISKYAGSMRVNVSPLLLKVVRGFEGAVYGFLAFFLMCFSVAGYVIAAKKPSQKQQQTF